MEIVIKSAKNGFKPVYELGDLTILVKKPYKITCEDVVLNCNFVRRYSHRYINMCNSYTVRRVGTGYIKAPGFDEALSKLEKEFKEELKKLF